MFMLREGTDGRTDEVNTANVAHAYGRCSPISREKRLYVIDFIIVKY
jgi:hypothetical protein